MEKREPFDADVALTHILVVTDLQRSRRFWVDVLGAQLYREYGGSSVVLRFAGSWVLLVSGGALTPDKPDVTFEPPADRTRVSHALTLRVADCRASYEALRERGATFLTPPYDRVARSAAFSATPTVTSLN
jgi:catechol 2,3-dioxygenase-like lactoylglutathione lyase family enzyme